VLIKNNKEKVLIKMVFAASFSAAANACQQRQVVVDGIKHGFPILHQFASKFRFLE
jgi:hypothetical protein